MQGCFEDSYFQNISVLAISEGYQINVEFMFGRQQWYIFSKYIFISNVLIRENVLRNDIYVSRISLNKCIAVL